MPTSQVAPEAASKYEVEEKDFKEKGEPLTDDGADKGGCVKELTVTHCANPPYVDNSDFRTVRVQWPELEGAVTLEACLATAMLAARPPTVFTRVLLY